MGWSFNLFCGEIQSNVFKNLVSLELVVSSIFYWYGFDRWSSLSVRRLLLSR